jgi:acetyl-CoA carboxylase carboxyltransferase component
MEELSMNQSDSKEQMSQMRESIKNTVGWQRISALLDKGSFQEIDAYAKSGEGPAEAVAGYGTVEGRPVCVFSQNGSIAGGAMSKAQASKIKKTFRLALKTGCPVVGIYDSIGARLNEGADMLAACGEILLDVNNLSGVVPQISLVLGPCVGTEAMVAAGADIVVMSPKGELTVSISGEDGSPTTAEKQGICHIAAENEEEAIGTVRRLLSMLPSNNLAASPLEEEIAPGTSSSETVGGSIKSVCDDGSFLELSPNFGAGAVTGFARIGGAAAGFIGLRGMLDADSCTKAARFLRFCDSFSVPVIMFVDAEKFSELRDASKLSSAYSEATTAKITVITGSACGPVYIATAGRGANADYTFAWPDAVISAVAPETAVALLWHDRLKGSSDPVNDRKKLIDEFRRTKADAFSAAADGMIEDIIEPENTRDKLIACLDMLAGKRVSTLPKKHADIQL